MAELNTKQNNSISLQLLLELRSRLLRSVVVLMLVFAVFMFFANNLYTFLAQPLLRFLPQGHLIATQIVAPFFVPFKLAFMAAIMLVMPFFLYQLWAFVAPALYSKERRVIWPFMLLSGILFYCGLLFAYFLIFPALFHFLANTAPEGVVLSPDIGEYLDFTIKMLLIFGTLFEIPIVMLLLVLTNAMSVQRFIKWRSYAIVGAFVLGMLLAPPDVLSQTLLAIPIWLLYEAGILLAKIVTK